MTAWYQRYKPAASARTAVLMAASMWTLVGAGLLTVGIWWSRSNGPIRFAAVLAMAAGVGLLKAHLVLKKAAARMLARIRARGDGRCLGGFLSWRTWVMVCLMMILGRLLRGGLLPRPIVAFIYEAVGVGLLAGATTLWRSLAGGEREEHVAA